MSIGANSKEAGLEVSPIQKVEYLAKKTVSFFFDDSLGYIFDLTLIGCIISLFFNHQFSWQFYVILLSLGGVQIYKFFAPEKEFINALKEKK